jgi:DNA-binding transcriptional LysR family regulator
MMAADTLTGIRVFCLVVEQKSFTAAARQLDISPGMASKHVTQLERRLRARLLNRSSRQVSLTEAGSDYHAKVAPLLEEFDSIEAGTSGETQAPRGTLRITAPVWFANPGFALLLARYQQRYPEVRLDIDLSGRVINLTEEGFDLALRVARVPGDNWIARPLGSIRFQFVAAPAYLARAGTPRRLADLATHSMLHYPLAPTRTLSIDGPHGSESVALKSAFQSANESLLHLAALQGMGYALLPDQLVADDLADGRLVELLGNYPERRIPLLGIYPNRNYLASRVRTFLDFMADAEVGQIA